MIELGKRQILTVVKKVDFGVYLADTADSADGNDLEVMLPAKEVPADTELHDPIDVFIYRDSSDRLIATTADPKLHVNEVGALIVKDVGKIGAFLDWGLPKDLLLPYKEQKGNPEIGDTVGVRVYIDKSNRLCASMWVTDAERKESAYKRGAQQLYDILKRNKEQLPLTDHSLPEEIAALTGMSKKEFKRAVGKLYKERKIALTDSGIRLINRT